MMDGMDVYDIISWKNRITSPIFPPVTENSSVSQIYTTDRVATSVLIQENLRKQSRRSTSLERFAKYGPWSCNSAA